MDCLNIHQSESLVRWIADIEGIAFDTLGVKGQVWHPPIDEYPRPVFSQSSAQGGFSFHPKALLLAQSG